MPKHEDILCGMVHQDSGANEGSLHKSDVV